MAMSSTELKTLEAEHPLLKEIEAAHDAVWVNPEKKPFSEAVKDQELTEADIRDAEERLKRFAPLIMKCFPETEDANGMIESPLTAIPEMQKQMEREKKQLEKQRKKEAKRREKEERERRKHGLPPIDSTMVDSAGVVKTEIDTVTIDSTKYKKEVPKLGFSIGLTGTIDVDQRAQFKCTEPLDSVLQRGFHLYIFEEQD